MSTAFTSRRCVDLLDGLRVVVATADAFGPWVRALHGKIAELRPFFDELAVRKDVTDDVNEALEAIHAALQRLLFAVRQCSSHGPFQVLLAGADLLHRMVNTTVDVQRQLARLHSAQLPTVVVAQARMLSAELSTVTVDFTTLRRLHSTCMDLQEEAERVRLGQRDDGAFAALVARLAATCSPAQLLSDTSFLVDHFREAEETQQATVANFYALSVSAVRALAASRGACSRSSSSGGVAEAQAQRPEGEPQSPRQQEIRQQQQRPVPQLGSDGGALLEQLANRSASQEQRVELLESFCRALRGPNAERVQAAEALAHDGPALLVRLVSTSPPTVRSAALRVLTALLSADPSSGHQLVAARGVQVLAHLLTTHTDVQQRTAQVTAQVATVSVTVRLTSPAGGRKVVRGRGQIAVLESGVSPGSQPRACSSQEVASGVREGGEGVATPEAEEVCLHAIAVLRQLFVNYMEEVLSTGVLKAMCRAAGLPHSGRLAAAATSALADAAHSGPATVQMLQERLLVFLADLMTCNLPSGAAAALACVQAIAQHPARLQKLQTHGDGQLCAEMGKACDAASTTVLLDLILRAEEDKSETNDSGKPGSVPALLELLPFCLHCTENRAAAMRHNAALRMLLRRVEKASGGPAALVLKRLASDESSKTALARQLSQALTACPGGPAGRQVAALACCLADVVRPASRDRAEAHWSASACSESEQCGVVRPLVALANSPDTACRAAGLSCLHALAVHGPPAVQASLAEAGAVVLLVDAVKLESAELPGGLQPPLCTPNTLGQAAVEALAALASASDALRKDVCMQLCPFLTSASPSLAASACQALLALQEASPSAGAILVALGFTPSVVALAARPRGGEAEAAPAAVQKRAVSLLWALCRGGGPAVDAAVGAGAARVLTQRVAEQMDNDIAGCLETAAALGPLLRKAAAARDEVCGLGGMAVLLELARVAPVELPLWEEAMAALAALAALHAASRVEATQSLRQMLVRGTQREVVAAAVVAARMSSGPSGREVLLAQDMVDPLVKLLTTGNERAKAAAADAIGQLAAPATVQLPACPALPSGGAVRPRLMLVRAGAIPALLGMLSHALEPLAAPSSSGASSASSRSFGAAGVTVATEPADSTLLSATEALESLAAGEEGAQAIRAAGGIEVLKDVVARGKRRLLHAAVAKAASNALLHCIR